ncbi:MAG: hypothetical protein CMK63_03890 [Pseudoalteromonadaceae bacterium]|nr:hypothetical protein [Pseudoalteromonadaceae bacterium]|tara:strand:- start:1269 stop:2174 length:906 start_codon:yes stop_codon:yes gene_type:complete
MGSKSSSNSRQQTNNTSTSLGVQGDNNGYMTVGDGNTYNIQQTDHGLIDGLVTIGGNLADNVSQAFNAANDMTYQNNLMTENVTNGAFDYARDVNSDSLSFADSVTSQFGDVVREGFGFGQDALDSVSAISGDALAFGADALADNANLARDSIMAQNYLAELSVSENSDLARDVASLSESMHATNTAFANNTLNSTIDAISDSNDRVSELAYYSVNNSSDLARDFAAGSANLAMESLDRTNEAYADAGKQTLLASEQALQFVDDMSRSDDSQLAKDTNKTMIWVVAVMAGVFALALTVGKR